MALIDHIARFTQCLAKAHRLVLLIAVCSFFSMAYALTSLPIAQQNIVAIPCLLLILWTLLFSLMIRLFKQVPEPAAVDAFIFTKVKQRLIRGFYHFIALLFFSLTLIVIYLTFKMLTLF